MTLDLSHLLDVFVAETREYLQALDVAFAGLDQASSHGELDRAALDEIFRVAHSLKGMCGMMGYRRMAALTHAMEEALADVRDAGVAPDRVRLDMLLACVGGLETALDEVAAARDEPEVLDTLARRVGAVADGDATTPADARAPDERMLDRAPPEATADPVPADALHVRVRLADDTELRSVRAYVVLRALGRIGTIARSLPADPECFDGTVVEAWLRGTTVDAVRSILASIPEIADIGVVEPGPSLVPWTPQPPRAPVDATVRVSVARLDELMFQAQEVLAASARLETVVQTDGDATLHGPTAELTRHAQRLQSSVMQVRMTPLDAAFARVPRLVRDLANRLGKDVTVSIDGAETEVDRSTVDALSDPLVHLVRNALDHGIEPAAERVAAGKPSEATLRVSARHVAGNVEICVTDDGRGVDVEAVAARALERGALDPADLTRARERGDLLELLFLPGVSGAETTTDISGRGVGLDSVRATVRDLGGDLSITSELGTSTTVRLLLPLTLAIMPTLLVRSAGEHVAVPLERVVRIMPLAGATRRSALGTQLVVAHDETTHPMLQLAQAVGSVPLDAEDTSDHAVFVQVRSGLLALGVDSVLGTRDVATRALPAAIAASSPPLLGIGMLADGSLATIVDCDRLAAGPISMEEPG